MRLLLCTRPVSTCGAVTEFTDCCDGNYARTQTTSVTAGLELFEASGLFFSFFFFCGVEDMQRFVIKPIRRSGALGPAWNTLLVPIGRAKFGIIHSGYR